MVWRCAEEGQWTEDVEDRAASKEEKTQMRFSDVVKEDMQCWCDIGGS